LAISTPSDNTETAEVENLYVAQPHYANFID